jgi:hypothetical protein
MELMDFGKFEKLFFVWKGACKPSRIQDWQRKKAISTHNVVRKNSRPVCYPTTR